MMNVRLGKGINSWRSYLEAQAIYADQEKMIQKAAIRIKFHRMFRRWLYPFGLLGRKVAVAIRNSKLLSAMNKWLDVYINGSNNEEIMLKFGKRFRHAALGHMQTTCNPNPNPNPNPNQ